MAYIDREKAKEFIKQYLYASIDSGQRELDIADGGVDICKVIDDTPTADVVEVRHGEWMKEGCCFYCSECKKTYGFGSTQTIYDVKRHWLHCPNCGAKMDGAKMSEMPTGSERVRVMICKDCPIRQYYAKMFDIHFDEKDCMCKCPYEE